jgi:phosphohistidine swiveling domain-containing protein
MMPDWNPAELLGEHPRPLARELFDCLVTQRAWRIGRAALGYARSDAHLMQIHAGRPYVDVRASLRSLLPGGLRPSIGDRIVDAGCERLRSHPALHDKIEFEVAFSSLTCAMAPRFAARYPSLLDEQEYAAFASALRGPTAAALDAATTMRMVNGFWRDLRLAPPVAEPERLRHWLGRVELRIAARFALVARQAFAVDALLRSAVESGALDPQVLQSARQHAGDIATGIDLGHVRAGTFEIAAPARREVAARAFAFAPPGRNAGARVRILDSPASARLLDALRGIDLEVAPGQLITHHVRLLRARELGKFVLARAVSFTLDAFAARAHLFGIGREDAGWLGLDDLLSTSADATALRARVARAQARHEAEGHLRMPLLIGDARLDVVHHGAGQPNFLGRGKVNGRVVVVDAHTNPDSVPLHAIVAIASADPGFDWIFLRQPFALLTAFGGPNSHMAIRCAEAVVPALLGVGPEAFRRVAAAARVCIDFDCRTWTST